MAPADGVVADDSFPAAPYCYLGNAKLVWTNVVADSLIGIAYLAISTTLGYLGYKGRRDIPFHWMFLAFGLFILACGGTHFMEAIMIWIPVYIFPLGLSSLLPQFRLPRRPSFLLLFRMHLSL